VWDDARNVLWAQEPLLPGEDVKKIQLHSNNADNTKEGYAYYWVMGDDFVEGAGESVWNTEGSVDDLNQILDSRLGKDGIYFIRTWAEDTSGNGNPRTNADAIQFGYTMVRVHNQDDIPPANTQVIAINGEDLPSKWNPLEWKWHNVTVATTRNPDTYWWFGNYGNDFTADNTNNKFFCDIDYVVVEMYDQECGAWINVTKDAGLASWTILDNDLFYHPDLSLYTVNWKVPIDSTLVGDGATEIRAYAVDNGGKFNLPYPEGDSLVHEQHLKRNV